MLSYWTWPRSCMSGVKFTDMSSEPTWMATLPAGIEICCMIWRALNVSVSFGFRFTVVSVCSNLPP